MVSEGYQCEGIIGQAGRMGKIYQLIQKVAPTNTNVFITGESGTGKELVARTIHRLSPHAGHPFVPVNCVRIAEGLLESNLFGHVRGAFTGAVSDHPGFFKQASQGTIFLDEIAEFPPHLQVKLLKVLQEKTLIPVGGSRQVTVDARVICASKRDLTKEKGKGQFREDLFYCLHTISFSLPPLRERKEDIPLLLAHFLKLKAEKNSVTPKTLSPEALDSLLDYPWPGNVRELENLVESLTILSPSETIRLEDFPEGMRDQDQIVSLKEEMLKGSRPLSEAVDEFERELILKALQKAGFNQTKAASLLRTSRRILRYKMEKLKISEEGLAD